MKTAIIVHGTGGYPEENWFPWLKEHLRKYGYRTIIPQFPTPKHQTPGNWFKIFNKHFNELNRNTILIGHSLGGTFLLRILEKIPKKIAAAVLVATPIGVRPTKFYKSDLPFTKEPFKWNKIKNSAVRFLVFHGKDDPYVSIKNGEKIAKELDTNLISLNNAGHFNAKSGCIKFPLLLKVLFPKKLRRH